MEGGVEGVVEGERELVNLLHVTQKREHIHAYFYRYSPALLGQNLINHQHTDTPTHHTHMHTCPHITPTHMHMPN